MSLFDVILLTDSRYVSPTEVDWYVQQILDEDGLVQTALEEKGLRVKKVDWADPNFDWSTTQLALFRTTWDYFHRFEEFSVWLDRVSTKTRLVNSFEQVRWNMDKHYLSDLKDRNITIPETLFIEKGEEVTLEQLHHTTEWQETVLKPTFSGGARHTYKLNIENLALHESIFRELIDNESMMLQPFQKNIVAKGEVAYMVFGGKFSHAVLKVAKKGDFRVQDDFGGTLKHYNPTKEEIAFAERAVSTCDPLPIYARVDVIRNNNDELAVVELELIEPELWFRFQPNSANLLADQIIKILA